MKMQLWELIERVEKFEKTHGDNVWLDADVALEDTSSGLLHVVINEGV